MNIEQRVNELLKRLLFLGYYQFQIKNIIQEAIGTTELAKATKAQRIRVIAALEKYERLGSQYVLEFSK